MLLFPLGFRMSDGKVALLFPPHPEFEELDQQDEGDSKAGSGDDQPHDIQRVKRLEARFAGYAEEGKESYKHSEHSHAKLIAPYAPLTLRSLDVVRCLSLVSIHGIVLVISAHPHAATAPLATVCRQDTISYSCLSCDVRD
ncbi:MAG: hypothetical protein JNK85_14365 [Verrucomicrobiales bacterium]|nr:hypothetical protein [Verrucomicrobiales bacterium]